MTLREKYIIARWCYGLGEDYISDMEYRQIEDELRAENPDDEYINRSWSDDPCPIELLKANGMEHLIKNVEFTHQSESIRSLYSETDYKRHFAWLHEDTYVSYKIDGWNTQINYYNGHLVSANTRGRSGNFMKADAIMKVVPQTIPIMGKVKVTGESSIPKSKWRLYALQTGNSSQRNSVSTAFARSDSDVLSLLAFNIQLENHMITEDRYDMLSRFGFTTPMRIKVTDFASLDRAVKMLGSRNTRYDYLTDGVVVENSQGQIALRIYEWEEKSLQSYVTGYLENTGSYGDALSVQIHPIIRDGIKQSKVSVTNIKYIVENNLQIGSPIAFDIRSAADAVLNTTKTRELQARWQNNYDEYKSMIDAG